jgi:adenosylcobinamide kinase/adenosylcobinamide-phosphate guanylyltransferase
VGKIVLITGGARSGKSFFALQEALKCPCKRVFVATALAIDREMERRIRKHRKERGNDFTTIEEPMEISSRLVGLGRDTRVTVVDCLTVWLGNLFHKWNEDEEAVRREIEMFCETISRINNTLVLVTNEVGFGIIPENRLARLYRDMLGSLNRKVAEQADQVYCCICGIPVRIKG